MFKPGQSGNPAGSKKGPRKARLDVKAILDNIEYVDRDGVKRRGVDPFKELAILAATARSEKVRREASADLAPFLAPKLKSIEHSGDSMAPLSINLVLTETK